MSRLLLVIVMCLMLCNCLKTDKEKSEGSNFSHSEQEKVELSDFNDPKEEDASTVQMFVSESKILPKIELSKESFFTEFPLTPDIFIENGIDVKIERVNQQTSPFPIYYGLEPVYVTGENFFIIYSTDNEYEIRRIILKGESIFSFWNPFFNATWEDVKKSWGEPKAEDKTYFDSTGWYYIGFTVDKTTYKIKEIEIGQVL